MTRALRILLALQSRLQAVTGAAAGFANDLGARVYIGKEDLFADQQTFPCATVLEGNETTVSRVGDRIVNDLDITVLLLTESDPTNPTVAGHVLLGDALKALFTEDATAGGDTLGGLCIELEYVGREISPREDGGQLTSVYIDLRARYRLNVRDPNA